MFWLAGWYLKAWLFVVYLYRVIETEPWSFDFFPPIFRSPATAQLFYALPMLAGGIFLTRNIAYYRFSAWIMILSSAVLAVHQDTHNDATFVTSFWSGVWALWLISQADEPAAVLSVHAKTLAALIVGMIFAGGFVGKLTWQYWNGTALTHIFGAYEAGMLAEWIKHLPVSEHATTFRALSRMLIVCEGLLSLSPFFPCQFLVCACVPLLLAFALTNTIWIYSVLMCLIGMVFATRLIDSEIR